jgi:hypothetical protein
MPSCSTNSRFSPLPRIVRRSAAVLAGLILALFVVSFFLDEPLRSAMEKNINRNLKGYNVKLPGLHVQLVGGSVTLKGLTVFQEGDPGNPIAQFPVLRAGIHWRAVLSGKLVAEFGLDRPKVTINLRQLRREAAGPVPVRRRGWQEAVLAIYPLSIDVLRIRDGELVYIDEDEKRPLHLSRLNLDSTNIRNVRSAESVYPSTFHVDTVIFGSGRGVLDGRANFLAEPHPGAAARFRLEKVPIDPVKPVIARSNFLIRNGVLDASGELEYAPKTRKAHVEGLTIRGMTLDYLHTKPTAAAERKRAATVAKAAGEAGRRPDTLLRIDEVRLEECTLGLVNRAVPHPFRVFFSGVDLRLSNLSNRRTAGPAEATLTGKFMGSGKTFVRARFRPEKKRADLDLSVAIEKTRLTAMNDLLLAYGGFDASAGSFSLYSELRIADGSISGYVKPFFKDMDVYDSRQDGGKRFTDQVYEMLIGGVATILQNRQRGEVATSADISGRLGSPETSTWQIVGQLMRNAFIKAIMPGFRP